MCIRRHREGPGSHSVAPVGWEDIMVVVSSSGCARHSWGGRQAVRIRHHREGPGSRSVAPVGWEGIMVVVHGCRACWRWVLGIVPTGWDRGVGNGRQALGIAPAEKRRHVGVADGWWAWASRSRDSDETWAAWAHPREALWASHP